MINLLPPKEKELLLQEEQIKLVWILGILFLSSVLCLTLFFFTIKILSDGEATTQTILVAEKNKEFENSQMRDLEEKIISTNKKISEINSFYQKQFYYTDLLNKITTIIPQGISLKYFSLERISEEKGLKCTVSGNALTRNNLIDFKNNLEKEKSFKEVVFPISSWVEEENISFSVTFEINQI